MRDFHPLRRRARPPAPPAALAGVLAGLWRRASRPNPRGWSTGFIASDAFLDTREWARARYEALRANDGRCELCGRGKRDGIRLEVDHIKPRHKRPDLALAVRNLQVLCGPNGCNSGKGGWRSDDWRPHGHPHRPPGWRGRLARWRAALARWW